MEKLKGKSLAVQTITTLIVALIGGWFASFLHVPIPWLLGSMFGVMAGVNFGLKLHWPRILGNIGIIMIGYTIGRSFTKEAAQFVMQQLPSIIITTLLMITFSFLLAYAIAKVGKIDFPSVLIGCIPGGLSQMILLAEEIKKVNISVVTFFQIMRLLMVVVFVPIIVFYPLLSGKEFSFSAFIETSDSIRDHVFPEILLFVPIVLTFCFLAKKIKFPTPYLVGPIFGTALCGLIGFQGPMFPDYLLDFSQLLIGAYFGLMLDLKSIEKKRTMAFLTLLTGLFLIAFTALLSFFVSYVEKIPYITSMLSLAPGGMDQMAVIGAELNADLSIIAGYQLFRLFFIFFAVPPLVKWSIHFYLSRKEKEKEKVDGIM